MKHGFFPPAAFHGDERHNDFIVQWYAKHLVTMAEPSLWVLSEDHSVHAYRFLWLRTFHQPVTVRLDVSSDGAGLLTAKVTDGRGGYESGKIVFDETTPLLADQVNGFLAQTERLQFWSLPTRDEGKGVGLDGAQWIMEGVQNGRYHLLDRHSPSDEKFRETALTLTRLANVIIRKIY